MGGLIGFPVSLVERFSGGIKASSDLIQKAKQRRQNEGAWRLKPGTGAQGCGIPDITEERGGAMEGAQLDKIGFKGRC